MTLKPPRCDLHSTWFFLQVSSEHLYSTTQYYNTIIQRIFDYESLKVASYVVERSIEYGNDQALSAKLEAILARLVSDYRAIFAIEEKWVIDKHQKTEDTTNAAAGKATEVHRKRHEGEDECPEEIKLIQFSKVLQAKCTSSCKARKRKERQETLVEHDSKFSRSSSETWDDSACDFTDSFDDPKAP
ncbi:hypothetical protein TCAL_16792 [Tigriopus californicus]|uniref:Uncharacterized protein n=1 Tax=Tigriopus californicus TaxID=6832 RepID=A0A553PTA6_TIGCA|nr:hypothetical protein TCAL_16792 [Tigriopus californicus]